MDPVADYLKQIGRHPLLTATEEIEYSRQIQAMLALQAEHPDQSTHTRQQRVIIRRGQRAKEQMIIRNLRLVVTIAKKYVKRCTTMEMLDLVQDGNMGLARATELFDPSRGYKFSTYAYWWIRQSISRGLQDRDRIIRLPIHRHEKVIKARSYMNHQLAMTGKMPTIAECAAAIDANPAELQASLVMAQDVCSLDAKASGKEDLSPILDLIPDPASLHKDDDFIVERDILHDAINMLSREEQDIVRRYNGLGGEPRTTLGKLGEEHGVSRQAISNKHTRAMNKIRQQIGRLTNERLRDGF
jgi:RNA polymerase sigma factor (sigma-70 family)